MKIRFVLWISLAISVMVSCSTSKKIPSKAVTFTKDDFIKALREHNYSFEWFHGKGNAKVVGFDQSHNVQTILRMQADSAIWVLFKKFEIEAIRALVTPEDYTVLYRLESGYTKGSTYQLTKDVGIDLPFGALQNWLFGNVIIPDEEEVQLTQDEFIATLEFVKDQWTLAYEVDKAVGQLILVNLKDAKGNMMSIKFGDYKTLDSGENIAFFRDIDMTAANGEKARLTFDFSEIEVNIPKELKFVVPSHYSEFE